MYKRSMDFLDSLSSSELLFSEFIARRKKNLIIYFVIVDILFAIFYYVRMDNIDTILDQKIETTLKVFTNSALWKEKSQVPFLKMAKFKGEALNTFVPLLETFVRKNDLLDAYIVDPEQKRFLAHSDRRNNDKKFDAHDGLKELSVMMDSEVELDRYTTTLKTKISMVEYKKGNSFILRTSAPIPYGKDERIVGVFIVDSPFDFTHNRVSDQKRFLPLVLILLLFTIPAALFGEYYFRVRIIKGEMEGFDESYIGPYKDVKLIGEGSMGKVYQATRMLKGKGVGRQSALKVMNKNLYQKKGFLKRFSNEAQMVARLGLHRNVVGLYDFGKVKIVGEESFGLEMPFIDGITLGGIIDKYNKDISVGQGLYISMEILNGLYHAHTRKNDKGELTPIVHRDISPKNILLSYNGSVLITDFGIAKSHDIASMTLAGELLGTFTNMSPEQANGENIDCRSDIFSLGTILHELLLKKKLYDADDIRVLWSLVSKAEIPEITGLDKQLERILLKSLAKKPSDRFQTALEMMNEIKEVIGQNYKEYNFDEKDMEAFLSSKR